MALPAGIVQEREGDRTYLQFPPSGCFGCSPTNSAGLRLRFFREGERIVCEETIDARYDGAPGIVHGGIQATLFDEVMCGAMVFIDGRYVVTGELTVRYEKACPSGAPIRISASIEELRERYAVVRGEIHDAAGTRVTRASGRFFYDPSRNPALGD